MKKTIKWIFLLGLVGGIGWVVFKWNRVQDISIDAFSLIPSDAIYCMATSDPIRSWKTVSASGTWKHLQKNAYFAELTESANALDSLIHKNDILFNLIGSRTLIVSSHLVGPKDYDFLFLVDLQKVSGIKFINEYLSGFTTSGLSFKKEKYGEEDILVLYNPSDKSNLYLSLPGTYLIASYTKKIVTSALDTYKNGSSITRETFTKAEEDLSNSGLLRLYVNYTMLPKFMSCYSSGSNEYVNRLAEALHTSGLSMTLDNEIIKASGHTYINDSIESYIKTLSISGKGPTDIATIAPQRTAFYLGFGFSSFPGFFANLEKNLQQDVAEYKSYRENFKQVENYLNISLQDNFINWIGDEVALLELQSSGKGLDNEVALILKADNIEKARKDLAHIEKMVKRRTPVKFKTVEYRGHEINYLSMKGLFKVLFGKFFARYDKPYYTIINNYVIFSNHPQTLQSMVDDYLDKNTLNKSDDFRTFRREFDDESAVFVYLNTPVLFNTMKKLADGSTRTSMESNKEYIVCFRQMAFQLVPKENRFKTLFAEQFVAPEEPAPMIAEARIVGDSEADSSEAEEVESADAEGGLGDSDPMELPYIYVQNVNASTYTSYFSDSTVHYKVELKNGFKDGTFTEYYESGKEKMTGHFKRDKRDGTWRLYDEKGKLILKRNYEGGGVKKERAKNQ